MLTKIQFLCHNPRGITTTFPPIKVLSKSIPPQTKFYTAHERHYS